MKPEVRPEVKNIAKDMRRDKKKVLILGAGYVTPPVVDYLASQGEKSRLDLRKNENNF